MSGHTNTGATRNTGKEAERMEFRKPARARRWRLLALLVSAAVLLAAPAPAVWAAWEDFAIETSGASLSSSEAGAHADFQTRWNFSADPTQLERGGVPWGGMRDVVTELPPGLLGNPQAFPTCDAARFVPDLTLSSLETCPTDTQVGIIEPGATNFFKPGEYATPLINLERPQDDPHVVARLGFVAVFYSEYIDIRLDPKRGYALTATLLNAPTIAPVTGSINRFWAVPTDSIHDTERFTWIEALGCAGSCGASVPSGLSPTPFMTNPTSCGPAEVGTAARTYEVEGFDYTYDSLPDITDCASTPFDPTLSLAPTTRSPGAASGVDVTLHIPQDGLTDPNGRASAHLKKAVVTMPEGVSLNASAADGLGSCSEEQIGVDRRETQIVAVGGHGSPVALSFAGEMTAELPRMAGAAAAREALEGLPGIGPGDVAVSGRNGGPWRVEFGGALADRDVPPISGVHSEVQQLAIAADSGTYTLEFEEATTDPIPFDADAAAVAAALEALPGVGRGNVEVTGGPSGGRTFPHQVFAITFRGALTAQDVPAIVATGALGSTDPSHFPVVLQARTITQGGRAVTTHTVKQGGSLGFDDEAPRCPESSKVATGEIITPVLAKPLKASVYIARQADNPFNSLFAGYLVARGGGVLLKVPAKFDVDPQTGQIVTTFDNNPQQPFSDLELHFKGGNRGLITTPDACGTYGSQYELVPWSGQPPAVGTSEFTIDANCGSKGFAPGFRSGTTSPLAGSFSTIVTQVTRAAEMPELTGIKVDLPPGVTGRLAGIPYCPDSVLGRIPSTAGTGVGEIAAPACPAASQVGTVMVGAGSGAPYYVRTGKVYLAGPYKGAPLSLAVVVPAVAGPFDLGNVVVRVAITLDPATAQVHAISDPLPTIVEGVPIELRDVRVVFDRPGFGLNPTNCEEEAATGRIEGAGGAVADVTDRFQVGECAALGFKPEMSLRVTGGVTRAKHPALTVVLRSRPGDANIGRVAVTFPKSELLDQSHIRTICTRVQFAADDCPAASIYGTVTATTPLLDYPLKGNVYLRSSSHELPDLVLDLRGPESQPIHLEAAGRTDSLNGRLRNTFELVPDAPLTRVVVQMQGGNKGLLQNTTNICRRTYRATVRFSAHNGRTYTAHPMFRPPCHASGKGKQRHGR